MRCATYFAQDFRATTSRRHRPHSGLSLTKSTPGDHTLVRPPGHWLRPVISSVVSTLTWLRGMCTLKKKSGARRVGVLKVRRASRCGALDCKSRSERTRTSRNRTLLDVSKFNIWIYRRLCLRDEGGASGRVAA